MVFLGPDFALFREMRVPQIFGMYPLISPIRPILLEPFQGIEMSDLRSFEDKERMKGHGKELCRRIKLFSERPEMTMGWMDG